MNERPTHDPGSKLTAEEARAVMKAIEDVEREEAAEQDRRRREREAVEGRPAAE